MAVNLGNKAGHDGKTNGNGYYDSHKPIQVDNSVFTYGVHIFYLQILSNLNLKFTNQLFGISVSPEPLNP
jgi:hypothetical protein